MGATEGRGHPLYEDGAYDALFWWRVVGGVCLLAGAFAGLLLPLVVLS